MKPQAVAPGVSGHRLRDIEAALWAEHDWRARDTAAAQIAAIQADNRARPVHGGMGRAQVRELAKQRADMMPAIITDLTGKGLHRGAWLARLGMVLGALDARAVKDEGQTLEGIIARLNCADWWTRQLWRAAVQDRERLGRERGEVCARRRQVYVTDDTVRRMLNQDAANARILAETELEAHDGTIMTLADLASVSTANPAIRRGELMTRIKGCEEWADAAGWPGLFTTHTTPSRFHATLHTGATNPKWIEAGKPTPKDGQAWLCKTWAKCRAAMARKGLQVFGVRVAEPHQDGTPHWHMLVWTGPGHREAVEEVMHDYWLRDEGDEPGAQDYRFKAKAMISGGAAGYVAKYISKGIDDAGAVGTEGHVDDAGNARVFIDQGDMFGGGAARVRMWARAHAIRQFQAIGQPPVTVWRELRRVEQDAILRAPQVVLECWDAVNRDGEKKASWAKFLTKQGGPCVGRGYRVAVATEARTVEGRYETTEQAKPVGVVDRHDLTGRVVPSSRKEWKPKGTWERDTGPVIVGLMNVTRGRVALARPQAAQPWTRVNNCTQQGRHEQHRETKNIPADGRNGMEQGPRPYPGDGRGLRRADPGGHAADRA